MKLLAFASLLYLFTATCNKKVNNQMEITGTIEPQGITSYQYGTHILTTPEEFYALRSEKVDLESFEGQTVTVIARKVEGYPVDGGPDYLEVEEVKNKI